MGRSDGQFVEFAMVSFARLSHAGYLMTGDRLRARDAAQTALELAYAQWWRVRRDDPYGYCRRVLVEDLIDRWRRPVSEYATGRAGQRRPGSVAEETVDQRLLGSMLSGLSPSERAVLVLGCYFDLPEAAVAQDLHVSIATVRRTAARALGKLRAQRDLPDGPAAVTAGGRNVTAHGTARHRGFPMNMATPHRRPTMHETEELRRLMLATEPADDGVRASDGIMAAGRRLRRRGRRASAAAAVSCVVALSFGVALGDVPDTARGVSELSHVLLLRSAGQGWDLW
jgi:RNA polymerase sigma factor (sigma-70 family)